MVVAGLSPVNARVALSGSGHPPRWRTVTVWTSNAATIWQAAHTGSISHISGLGDKAFWHNDNTLYVLSGLISSRSTG
jgi:hypothetical protein